MQLNFDANQVAPSKAFEPIPTDWYKCAIDESEMKPTRDGLGSYLQLNLKVLEGPHTGRVVFDRLNLRNNNEVAQQIAYETLSAICHAVNVLQVTDSQQLHGIPMMVRVKQTPPTAEYDAGNEVKGYKAVESGMQQPQMQGQQPQMQGQPQMQQQAPQQQPTQQVQQQAPQQPWQQGTQQQQAPQQQQEPVQQQQAPQQGVPSQNQGGAIQQPPWAQA